MRVILMLGALLAHPGSLPAQSDSTPSIRVSDVILAGAGGVAYVTPELLGWNVRLPGCAPCDRSNVPWFDRWAIDMPTTTPSAASTVLILGLGVSTWWDMARNGPRGIRQMTASMQSATWAVGAVAVTKVLVARKRPVLYTSDAGAAARILDNQRSWPSGHSAAAAALATSYLLSRKDAPDWARWAAVATALTVGTLRVVAHRHFPSDVLAGAAIGVGSAVIVHEIRF